MFTRDRLAYYLHRVLSPSREEAPELFHRDGTCKRHHLVLGLPKAQLYLITLRVHHARKTPVWFPVYWGANRYLQDQGVATRLLSLIHTYLLKVTFNFPPKSDLTVFETEEYVRIARWLKTDRSYQTPLNPKGPWLEFNYDFRLDSQMFE